MCARRELQISLAASSSIKCHRSMFNWDCWTPKSHKIGAQFHTILKRQKELRNENFLYGSRLHSVPVRGPLGTIYIQYIQFQVQVQSENISG